MIKTVLGNSLIRRKVQRENPGRPPRNITADADESVGLLVESPTEGGLRNEMRVMLSLCQEDCEGGREGGREVSSKEVRKTMRYVYSNNDLFV